MCLVLKAWLENAHNGRWESHQEKRGSFIKVLIIFEGLCNVKHSLSHLTRSGRFFYLKNLKGDVIIDWRNISKSLLFLDVKKCWQKVKNDRVWDFFQFSNFFLLKLGNRILVNCMVSEKSISRYTDFFQNPSIFRVSNWQKSKCSFVP